MGLGVSIRMIRDGRGLGLWEEEGMGRISLASLVGRKRMVVLEEEGRIRSIVEGILKKVEMGLGLGLGRGIWV